MDERLARRFSRDVVVTRAEIVAFGGSDRWIRSAVRVGEIVRLRYGVFCLPGLDALTRRAVAAGGRLACVSELRRLGVWVIERNVVHIQFAPHGSRRAPSSAICHWRTPDSSATRTAVSPAEAITQAASCIPFGELVAAIDSALRQDLVQAGQLAGRSTTIDRALAMADARAESGLESLIRMLLVELGLGFRLQAVITGVGRVDFLVEERVVVEADGDEFHGSAPARARDRIRDAAAVAAGYSALRFDYAQIVFQRELVARAIVNAVRIHRGVKGAGRRTRSGQKRIDVRRFS